MKRLSDGRPVNEVEALLRKNRTMRSEPQTLTPMRALAKKSLDAAIKAAKRKVKP